MTSSNGNIFRIISPSYEENQPITGEFPSQMSVTRSFDICFDVRLNKRLSKPSICWWSETPWQSSWRHCNVSCSYEIEEHVLIVIPWSLSNSTYPYAHTHTHIYIHCIYIYIYTLMKFASNMRKCGLKNARKQQLYLEPRPDKFDVCPLFL